VIVPVTICQIPFITSIWLAPQCTKNGRHCPSPVLQPTKAKLVMPSKNELNFPRPNLA
jgi:hypothetical protein